MGPQDPPVTIRSGTLAGGPKNQDRHAFGQRWAFVLDGASSFSTDQSDHDGGWYAGRLKAALEDELTTGASLPTETIVARAIRGASRAHVNPKTCPTSTIALARWDEDQAQLYALGDSTVASVTTRDDVILTDNRIAEVGQVLRNRYRARLQAGSGFDEIHRGLLRELQERQRRARNSSGGFWIAGADPKAASQALHATVSTRDLRAIVLSTDGAAAAITRYALADSWEDMSKQNIESLLHEIRSVEEGDPSGAIFPRSKIHDDASLIIAQFGGDDLQ